ncbi:MAG: ABC-F family ATP-binding cassette domain-containing protein [Marinovum sp.]|nr:ABC-F family ATP-binding cassette domain-containing protein [Marinovum sp.]
MLRIDKINYAIDGKPLFEDASATIPTGHRVGLVGRNGSGKTTLFRLIRNELSLESGDISIPLRARVAGVAQEVPSSQTSLLNTVLQADTERTALLEEITNDPDRIAEIQARLADIDAWSAEARAASILRGLGFDADAIHRPCSEFSGGWRMRVALAAVLFASPDMLLLDEPTNYLDLEGAVWLEAHLAKYPHTVLLISHDRGLLNRAVDHILHLEDRKLTLYGGPYDTFAKTRAAQRAVQAASAKKQDARRAHLQSFVDRFRYKASKARQAQSRLKMIERMDLIAAPEDAAARAFHFPDPSPASPPIISIEEGSVGYDGHAVLNRMSLRIDPDDRIALLGKNGEGKSTLSKLLAGKLPLLVGQKTESSKLTVGYFAQHQVDELDIDGTPLTHLAKVLPNTPSSKLRARLAGFGLGADVAETTVGALSGGQKARLSLLLATWHAPHLLILDEPTNHLDIESREALVEALAAYQGAVILVSHDMHLLNLVADRLWLVKEGRVTPYDTDLEAYRGELIAPRKSGSAKPKPKLEYAPKRASRDTILKRRAELRKCEERIEKLTEMHEKLTTKLADPALYEDDRIDQLEGWNRKYAELEEAMDKAETLWMAAQEALDAAEDA